MLVHINRSYDIENITRAQIQLYYEGIFLIHLVRRSIDTHRYKF